MAHIHEKIDFTVEAIIVCNDKVLLRLHEKYHIRLSIGWHIELDEDPVQATYREVLEEVGLQIKVITPQQYSPHQYEDFAELIPPFFLNRHRISESHEHVTMTYIATTESDVINIGEWEADVACKWLGIDELKDPQYNIKPSLITNASYAINFVSNLS